MKTPNAPQPKYIRIKQAVELTGLSKPKLFQLIKSNRVRSASLGISGQKGSTRLIDRESLLAFIEARMQGGNPEQKEGTGQ